MGSPVISDEPPKQADEAQTVEPPAYDGEAAVRSILSNDDNIIDDGTGHFGAPPVTKGSAAKKGRGRPRTRPRDADDKPIPQTNRLRGTDIVQMVKETDAAFFRTPAGVVYVTLSIDSHRETHPLHSDAFSNWLTWLVYQATKSLVGAQIVSQAAVILGVEARLAPVKEPWMRVGRRGDTIYLDLVNDRWEVVEIRSDGWDIVPMGDLPFVRRSGMLPGIEPVAGGNPGDFAQFFTVPREELQLMLSWVVFALSGGQFGAYTILVLNGEQGSGKTTLCVILRELVDPNEGALQPPPAKPDDFGVIISDSHCFALDNASSFESWLYDSLCRAASNGTFLMRTLHTTTGVTRLKVKKPILINGIPELVGRADFVERTISVRLPSIPPDKRRTEQEIWDSWGQFKGLLMGIVCDGLSSALRNYRSVRQDLGQLSRMADFTVWSEAAAPGLGFEPGDFMRAFNENRREMSSLSFDTDIVAGAVARLVPRVGRSWSGSPTELLAAVGELVSEEMRRNKIAWPQSAMALGARLDRATPVLRENGIVVTRTRGDRRTIIIERISAGEGAADGAEGS